MLNILNHSFISRLIFDMILPILMFYHLYGHFFKFILIVKNSLMLVKKEQEGQEALGAQLRIN